MTDIRWFIAPAVFLFTCSIGFAAEVIPARPPNHFNDYAKVVSAPAAAELNEKLADFERKTSSQIIVAVYPKMQTDSSIEDYTVRVFNTWEVGTKENNNGAALFVFIQDRKMFIVTGYGLEGALPDATCKQIVEQEIKPHFKAGDFEGGLRAGIDAMLAATQGEYRGSGRTAADGGTKANIPALIFLFIVMLVIVSRMRKATLYSSYGRSSMGYLLPTILMNSGRGGSGSGGGWSSGGGGGSFSGGGGSSGGGGAGGSW